MTNTNNRLKPALTRLIEGMITMSPKERVQVLTDFLVSTDLYSVNEREQLLLPYTVSREKRSAAGKAYSEIKSYAYPGFMYSDRDCTCWECGGHVSVGDAVFILKRGKQYRVWHPHTECFPKDQRSKCERNKRYLAWTTTGLIPPPKHKRNSDLVQHTEKSLGKVTQTG